MSSPQVRRTLDLTEKQPLTTCELGEILTFTVKREVSDVFRFASQLPNLMNMLKHLDKNRLEVIKMVSPLDLEITEYVNDAKIAWIGITDAGDIIQGKAFFFPLKASTAIQVSLNYVPNKSKLREKIALSNKNGIINPYRVSIRLNSYGKIVATWTRVDANTVTYPGRGSDICSNSH